MTWTLHLGDCLEYLKTLPDGSVDAVVTDPPYGVGLAYKSFEDSKDNVSALAKAWLPEALRVSKIVAFTPGKGRERLYPEPTWTLGWAMPSGGGMCSWGFQCYHPILVYGKCPYLANRLGGRPDTFFPKSCKASVGKDEHPCAKPLNVMEWLVGRIDPFGNATILDPFAGSGTTGIACIKTGRNFIGCEISPEYHAIATRRLKEAEQADGLFVAPKEQAGT